MNSKVLIFLIFAVIFLVAKIILLIKMNTLIKKHKEDTAEVLSSKLNPFQKASKILTVLIAVCVIAAVIIR